MGTLKTKNKKHMSLTNRIIIPDSSKVASTGLPSDKCSSPGSPSPWHVPGIMCLTHLNSRDAASGGRYYPRPIIYMKSQTLREVM